MRVSEPPPVPASAPDGDLTTSTLAELTAAGQVTSSSGQAALLLARRLNSPVIEPGSAMAAMIREHRTALADALRTAVAEVNPLDELRSRRDRKRATG